MFHCSWSIYLSVRKNFKIALTCIVYTACLILIPLVKNIISDLNLIGSKCRKAYVENLYILYQNTCKLYCFVLCGFLLMFTNKVKGKVKILNVCDFLQEMWVNYDTIDIVGDRNRQRQLLHWTRYNSTIPDKSFSYGVQITLWLFRINR